ncbi:GNAT family N-acetyltransferase [Marinivivus vitaminiproducens]|uniref:GNAT family N-acetyltransferase n=1 Tax=Marinivivus vitaminiproducens TaxID=3035935 RepID=UPI0027982E50|nr:GNAT family N-acetyltransferase [Geminicoccaceae bacterium SCSIO 64248]
MSTDHQPPARYGTGQRDAPEGSAVELVTRIGFRLRVRPVTAEDEPALANFFHQVTPDDLRFRFLTGVNQVNHSRLVDMIRVDQERTESFLVTTTDPDSPVIAAAMLAADESGERAEVAISIRGDHKGRGIGWTLLDHLANHAQAKGIKVLESIESRENRQAIALEREMGFVTEPVEGDSTLVVLRRSFA